MGDAFRPTGNVTSWFIGAAADEFFEEMQAGLSGVHVDGCSSVVQFFESLPAVLLQAIWIAPDAPDDAVLRDRQFDQMPVFEVLHSFETLQFRQVSTFPVTDGAA